MKAIRLILEQATSSAIRSYIHHYNIQIDKIKVAIILQEFKTSVYSGVVFTKSSSDPDFMHIAVSRGNSGVVRGDKKSYSICVRKRDFSIVSDEKSNKFPFIKDLAKLCVRIKTIFKKPQDIEWLFDGKKLWIVQSRPITASSLNGIALARKEIEGLQHTYGPKTPRLIADKFLDGVEYITPLTLSFLRKVYSPDGSWGKILKKYTPAYRSFDSSQYIISVLGRPYINATYEDIFLKKKIIKRSVSEIFLLLVTYIRRYIGRFRMFSAMYLLFKKRKNLHTESAPEFLSSPNIGIGNIVEHIINTTAVQLLKISLFQQAAYLFLEKKIRTHVDKKTWELATAVVFSDDRAGNADIIDMTEASLQKTFYYKGFQEIELSQPRWSEDEEVRKKIIHYSNKKKSSIKSSHTWEIRTAIIEKFQSKWDQEITALFFHLYDYFSELREEIHISWLINLYHLRMKLLKLDAQYKLYNSIWYTTLDDVVQGKIPSVNELFKRRRIHESVRLLPLSVHIIDVPWDSLLEHHILGTAKKYEGSFLVTGNARGHVSFSLSDSVGMSKPILVLKNLDPSLVIYFDSIQGVVCEVGNELSHAAIVAREYGIPVFKMKNACSILKGNMEVAIYANEGVLHILDYKK